MDDQSENTIQSLHDKAVCAEGVLFAEGNPISRRALASFLSCDERDLPLILAIVEKRLTGGIMLVQSANDVALAVAPSASRLVQRVFAQSMERDIGNAGLEVLAIVLYRGATTRAEIDYIRGVNTSSTIRMLRTRGLVERSGNPRDGREYVYQPTLELLAHMGVRTCSELPEYDTIHRELETFDEKHMNLNHHADTASSS